MPSNRNITSQAPGSQLFSPHLLLSPAAVRDTPGAQQSWHQPIGADREPRKLKPLEALKSHRWSGKQKYVPGLAFAIGLQELARRGMTATTSA